MRHTLFAIAFSIAAFASPRATASVFDLNGTGMLNVDLNLGSYHTQEWARDELNQKNPGVGMTYRFSRSWAVAGGMYENSYDRSTWYVLAQWTPVQLGHTGGWHVDAGLAAGLATGYRPDEVVCAPLIGGGVVRIVSPSGVSLDVFGAPGAGDGTSGFLGFQLSLPFGD